MRFLLPLVLIATMSLAPIPQTPPSVVRLDFTIDGNKAGCTGFYVRINAIITAAHCKADDLMLADGQPVTQIKSSEAFQLFETTDYRLPLKLSTASPGETVILYGNAYSLGIIKIPRYLIRWIEKDLWIDGAVAPGMSGGPVVNSKGEVIGLIQSTFNAFANACGVEEIKDFIK